MAYFSNSTDGDVLTQQCETCPACMGCPIYRVQLEFNYIQLDKGNHALREAMNMLVDKRGVCQMRVFFPDMRSSTSDPPVWLTEDYKG